MARLGIGGKSGRVRARALPEVARRTDARSFGPLMPSSAATPAPPEADRDVSTRRGQREDAGFQ